jgi:hypothetical protein
VEHGFGAGCEGVVRDPRQHLLKTNRKFQAGEVRSEAAMYSGPESEMAIVAAIEDAPIGFRELARVAVSGSVVHQYRLARAESVSGEFDVLGDSSRYAVNRSAEANELLDGSWQYLRFAGESVAFVGICCQIVECE